ncbi:MAG TPA: NAD(P)-dependent alcohol dehydrogenase, partial [Polyangiaceae bacterium]|nr:NAD(P)-dependent alcohol dehydrogenase [Polyangiaceae bacterium]
VGDLAGVGCMVDACRVCPACERGTEQYCDDGPSWTYNSFERDKKTPTYGGYSTDIVVDEAFTLRVDPRLDPASAAPLLCAGITMYSPLRHWNVQPGQRVGVVGLGGLGHMAVKLARAMGAEVTVFSSSAKKRADAARLGASELVVSSDDAAMAKLDRAFDLVLDTVSAAHDLSAFIRLLKTDASLVLLGIPDKPFEIPAGSLIGRRRSVAGSVIGGIAETQEMLDFCAERGVSADIEIIAMRDIDVAYERMMKSDVRYRFVIDIATLRA